MPSHSNNLPDQLASDSLVCWGRVNRIKFNRVRVATGKFPNKV